jgi:hypothetical protein
VDVTQIGEYGGRKKAIELAETALKEVKAKGITVKGVQIGEPGKQFTQGKHSFVVVPTVTEMTFPKGTLRKKSYRLGISADGGKTWTFVDGTGSKSQAIRDKVLPKLPEKLVLPQDEKHELIPREPAAW